MSDLISRKDLYNKLVELEEIARNKALDTSPNDFNFQKYVTQLNERKRLREMILEQPTIFNVEKVVEQLEERKNFYENRFSEMSGTDRDVEDWGSIKSYEDAIDIVKRGRL